MYGNVFVVNMLHIFASTCVLRYRLPVNTILNLLQNRKVAYLAQYKHQAH